MIEDLITFPAVMVMVFTHVWMAIIVRDGVRAKGLEALFICAVHHSPSCITRDCQKGREKELSI